MIDTIVGLFLKTVKAYPFHVCKQPQSFNYVPSRQDTNTANFGMTYSDFKKGYYWGRKFEAMGQDENLVIAEKPAIYLSLTGTSEQIKSGQTCLTFEFGAVDIVDCDTCGEDCKRNSGEIKRDLSNLLRTIKGEVMKNAAFDVIFTDGTTKTIWATLDELNMTTTVASYEHNYQISSIDKLLKFEERIITQAIENSNEITAFMSLTYCDCDNIDVVFDYSQKDSVERVAYAKCHTCI